MNFKKTAPKAIISAVIFVVVAISLCSYYISHRLIDTFEKQEFELMGSILQTKFRDSEKKALSIAETIAAMPSVQKNFSEKNRTNLLATVKNSFDILREEYDVRTSSFFLLSGEVFLRLHRPSDYGDDVSNYRKLIVEVNREQANRKGIEISATGVSLYGVAPVMSPQGIPLGSFEIGLDLESLIEEIKKSYGFELALLIEEERLRSTAKLIKPDIFSAKNRIGPYIIFSSTHPDLLQTLVTDRDLNIVSDNSYIRDSAGIPYGVLVQPLYNFAKQPIGMFVIAKNFTETRSANGQSLVWQVLLGVTAIIILIGVILVVIRGLILRPLEVLTTHIASLANKNDFSETQSTNDWCEEMKLLNAECEKLASKNKK